MPTLNNMEIPKPQNWQDFEQLVESYLRIRCPNYMIALFGRGGKLSMEWMFTCGTKTPLLLEFNAKKWRD